MIRSVLSGIALSALAGCQHYSPSPLDAPGHRAAWALRSPDSETVRAYAARLGIPPPSSDAAGLTLHAGELVAMCYNQALRNARARAAVALASSENAGLWDDPSLSFDVLRVTENIPDPWVIGGVVGFTLPLSGRLSVERAIASAEHELELRRVIESECAIQALLRSTWMEWSASKLEADLLRDLLERVDAIVEIADRLETANSMSRLEARLFRMERAARRSELLLLNAQTQQLELQLKSLLGLMPDAPIALIPQVAGEIPEAVDDVFEAIEQRNPTVAVHRAVYAVAEENLHLEIRKQYPDLQIGPAYEWDEGQNKVGLGAGLPLPLLNANKQGIAVARAERDAVRAEYETAVEGFVSAYWQARSQLAATTAAREAIEQELLPLAEAQIDDARRVAELGEFDVLLTLESVVRAHDTKVQLINARLAEAKAASALRALCVQEPQVMESETNS